VDSLGKFPDRFLEEIAGQPDALRRAAEAIDDQAGALAAVARRVAAARAPVFTGMGSSYHACYAPVTLLASRGVPASMVDAAELLHFRLPAIGPGSVVVAVTQSGESAELVRLVGALEDERPGLLVSVTNGLANTVAAAADVALDTRAGAEEGPSTGTFAAALAVLDGVAGNGGDARAAARAAERLLDDAEALADDLRAWLGDRPALVLLGRGAARAAAEMGALTCKEAARFPAESLQAAQFRHGPLELAGSALAAIVFATEERTRALDLRLAGEIAAAGAAVLVLSEDGDAPSGARGVAIGAVDPGLRPAVAIIPVQLLAWRLARERSLTPGAFALASKVTTRE
jgi:glutamine---fructose-6-phosphate transaminase (isomerizing)